MCLYVSLIHTTDGVHSKSCPGPSCLRKHEGNIQLSLNTVFIFRRADLHRLKTALLDCAVADITTWSQLVSASHAI